MIRATTKLGALALALAALPAQADVKSGVDAWTAGDYARAVREWAGPAKAGDADAQFNLAQAYRLGRGVETDLAQAEALYAKAAQAGHIKAADNYGLLLFQRGEREKAMPYIEAAALRGDPRGQYVMGIAHFNGDLATKDWVRAYALLTLAQSAGLPQAKAALGQMDAHIPLEQRQEAQTLAGALKLEADNARASELAAADLATGGTATVAVPVAVPPQPPVSAPPAKVVVPRVAGRAAGADYTLPGSERTDEGLARDAVTVAAAPAPASPAKPAMAPAARPVVVAAAERPAPVRQPAAATGGSWKVQLGAFGVAGNADRLWTQLSARRELAGATKVKERAGSLTKLLAGGFASRAAAETACAGLKRSGQSCIVTQ